MVVQWALSLVENHRGISKASSQWNHCQHPVCFDPDAEHDVRAHAPQFTQLEPCKNKDADVSFGTVLKDNKTCSWRIT